MKPNYEVFGPKIGDRMEEFERLLSELNSDELHQMLDDMVHVTIIVFDDGFEIELTDEDIVFDE